VGGPARELLDEAGGGGGQVTDREEELLSALTTLYTSMYYCGKEAPTLSAARDLVEPLLLEYEVPIVRRVMKQRAERRQTINEESFK
jgi:hypothetical protein